ncbi:MAG: carbon storage regulator CsrA [Gammaproteobacteria bacterium]
MLVLTRRSGESIIIGEGDKKIVVTILDTHNKGSRIGVAAPKDISVHREEVYERIQKERSSNGGTSQV